MNCRCPSGTVRANNTTSRQGTVHQIQVCQVVWAGSMHHDDEDDEGVGVDDDHGDSDDSDDQMVTQGTSAKWSGPVAGCSGLAVQGVQRLERCSFHLPFDYF